MKIVDNFRATRLFYGKDPLFTLGLCTLALD